MGKEERIANDSHLPFSFKFISTAALIIVSEGKSIMMECSRKMSTEKTKEWNSY